MVDLSRMKNCEMSVIKYLLFGFNLVFAISGIGIIVAGALVLSDVGEFRHFMENRVLAPPVVLIVAGCIVFLVASLGCYGALRESYLMLMAFAVCLLVIFIIELAVGIAAAVYHNEAHKELNMYMKDSLKRYNSSQSDKIAWDNLQSKMECCGVDKVDDWEKSRPASCCHPSREGAVAPTVQHCQAAKENEDILYSTGCFSMIEMKVQSASKVLIGVGIGIAFIEVIGIVLACWMASAIKNRS